MRVASQPPHHPYVAHLRPEPGHAAMVGEPVEVVEVVEAIEVVDVWDVAALAAVGVDVVHLHFGFEQRSLAELRAWRAELARAGMALVYTAHDLDNPHLVDQTAYRALVAELAGTADEVITLTGWARDRLIGLGGRQATVLAHPHVVELDDLRHRADTGPVEGGGAYVHVPTLRPNLDLDVLAALADQAPSFGGLVVHLRSAARAGAAPEVRRVLDRVASAPGVDMDVTPGRLTDAQLWDRIQGAGAVVLPYRWGTHSGLIEAARDLGVRSVAPAHGAYGDQGAELFATVADCVTALARPSSPAPVPMAERVAQRRHLAAEHQRIYRRALTRLGVPA